MRAALLIAALLAGCAAVKTYPTDPAGNVVLRTDVDPSVRAAVHVHSVDAQCGTQYQGRALLEQSTTVISIPADRASYLVVVFDTSSLLRGSAATSVGALVRPRPGLTHELSLRYHAGIYDVSLRETDRRRGASRDVPRRDLSACRPA